MNPGAVNPGAVNPGAVNPGAVNPGAVNPGAVNPGAVSAGAAGSGAAGLAERAWRLTLVGTLVSAVGGGLTLPFLIVYLHDIRHLSLPLAGVIVAASGVAGIAVGTVGGSLGDRVGVGRVMLGGLVVGAVGTAGLAFVSGPGPAAVAVALVGAGDAIAWPALNALVASQLPPQRRARGYALRFGVLNAGLGIGGLVSGSVVSLHRPGTFEAIYLADAATTLLFAVIVTFGLRRSAGYGVLAAPDPPTPTGATADGRPGLSPEPPAPGAASPTGAAGAGRDGYRAVLDDRRFMAWIACSAVFVLFGYAQLDGAWAAFATGVVGASPQVVGVGFAVNTSVIVVSQLGVVHLTRRWRRSRMLVGVGACWALAWAVTGLADWSPLAGLPADVALAVSLGIFAVGETLLTPVSGALPNDLAPEHLRHRYNALASAVWAGGGLVGPPVAGVLLGSSVPVSWVVVITAGCGLAGVGGLRLARRLPADIDRPPFEPAARANE
jgi:MFS family permease